MARLSRSMVAGLLLCVVGTVLLAAPASTSVASSAVRSDSDGRAEEQQFIDRINGLRASKGLALLAVDPELTSQSRIWSQTMKDAGKIFHSSDLSAGISSNWQKLGENVGVGGTVDALFNAFVASPKHYENLVDPAYRYIGVGVVWDGDRMFTAHRFMAVFPSAPTTTKAPARPKPKVVVAPTTAPTTTTVVPRVLAATDAAPTTTTTPPAPAAPAAPPTPARAQPSRLAAEMAALIEYLR